jgi:hypothetical protein
MSAPLHDEVTQAGVGAHELGPHDDEEGQPDADPECHDDTRQRGGEHDAANQVRPRGAQAGRRTLDKSVLTERIGKLAKAKLELVLFGIDIVLGR